MDDAETRPYVDDEPLADIDRLAEIITRRSVGSACNCSGPAELGVMFTGSDIHEALRHVASGKVKPTLELYPIDKANEVRDRLAAGKVRYRAVLQHRA